MRQKVLGFFRFTLSLEKSISCLSLCLLSTDSIYSSFPLSPCNSNLANSMSSNTHLPEESPSLFIPILHQHDHYEKLRPLEINLNHSPEHQAHGDDTDLHSFQLLTHDNQSKAAAIPPMSSSSNEFSFEMAMQLTDTSNEALKTDDENGMTKSYFLSDYHRRSKNQSPNIDWYLANFRQRCDLQ